MSFCSKCSLEISISYILCSNCETQLVDGDNKRTSYPWERGSSKDSRNIFYSSLFFLGFFLLIIGIIFSLTPDILVAFQLWIKQMVYNRTVIRPPESIIVSAAIFFSLIGLSNFFKAFLIIVIYKNKRRFVSNILSGAALALFAYLIDLYGGYSITWQMVLGIEAVAIGMFVILYSLILQIMSLK